jgi:hypothetical protein
MRFEQFPSDLPELRLWTATATAREASEINPAFLLSTLRACRRRHQEARCSLRRSRTPFRTVPFAYMPSLIPRQVGWNLFARTIPPTSAFPRTGRVGSCIALAQRSLTLRPARSPGGLRDPLHQRLQRSRCLHLLLRLLPGWSEPVPGRVYPHCGPTPSHGAPVCRLPGSWPDFVQMGLGRGMIWSDICLRLCGWEIRDEGSGAA